MNRIVLLGPGGSGKSVLAHKLGSLLKIPVKELDKVFWTKELKPMDKEKWEALLKTWVEEISWVIDGDLGDYEGKGLEIRLEKADTVIFLDFPRWLCLWNSWHRSKEKLNYWVWVWNYKKRQRPRLLRLIKRKSPQARKIRLKNRKEIKEFLNKLPESKIENIN